jgi:dCMP deaminase
MLDIAEVMSRRATCALASVGVVIARDGRIISTGYNGAPAGMEHCHHDLAWGESEPCLISVHAEANALAYAARLGNSTDGGTLYSTHMPCINCAKLIVNSGIVRVVGCHPYRDTYGVELLFNAGIPVHKRDLS